MDTRTPSSGAASSEYDSRSSGGVGAARTSRSDFPTYDNPPAATRNPHHVDTYTPPVYNAPAAAAAASLSSHGGETEEERVMRICMQEAMSQSSSRRPNKSSSSSATTRNNNASSHNDTNRANKNRNQEALDSWNSRMSSLKGKNNRTEFFDFKHSHFYTHGSTL